MTQMHAVIDANVVVGYFKETVKGAISGLTISPTSLLESLGSLIVCYVDNDSHIATEWRQPVEPEWFDAWYSGLLISDGIRITKTDNCRDLKAQLKDLGFPTTTKDFWYCRVGVAVAKKNGKAHLITEDLDFYEPSEKGCGGPRRKQLLYKSDGRVAKHLRQKSGIEVICVDNACSPLTQIRNPMKTSDPFEKGLAAGEAAASAAGGASQTSANGGRMYVRTQSFGSTDAELRFLQRCGVRHKAANFPFHPDRGWDLDELIREREHHEAFGLTLDMSLLPIYQHLPNIIYFGKSPERDREIDLVCEMIRTASRAGIDSLRYNTCILPIDRTEQEEGRGGYVHTAFRLDKVPAEEQAKLTEAGRVTADMHWERIEYLLERMIPVAEEFKVRMGNSQEDPATPPGYKGVDKVLNDFEGMKRFIEIQRSPYHGWNFCVGSIAEGLKDSANEIYPIIEYFGSRNTIFLVHYRNLLGGLYSFREALPDEGDMDFHRVLKGLKDTGYCYGIDPDHVPRTDDDPKGYYQSHAYCFGYINAMIQAIYG